MRPIKFRVFVKPGARRYREGMHTDWDWISGTNFDIEFNPDKTLFRLALAYPDDFALMQYTGLKDKNGKEIYEGDILSGGHGESTRWGCKAVVVEHDESKAGFFPFASYDSDCDEYFLTDECEVIGNIYETPELLETK